MIGRVWRGQADADKASEYEAHFQSDVVHELNQLAGFRGAYLLRHDGADRVEFVTLTLFDSMDAVRGFAGDDPDTAVVAPAAQAALRDYDRTVRHYTIIAAPTDPT